MPCPGKGFLNQSRNCAVESTWSSFLDREDKVTRETDSLLEGDGFEPSVPRRAGLVHRVLEKLGLQLQQEILPGEPQRYCHLHISTSAPSSMTRSGGMRKNSVGRVAMRARPE
jgi:hypothetical protein